MGKVIRCLPGKWGYVLMVIGISAVFGLWWFLFPGYGSQQEDRGGRGKNGGESKEQGQESLFSADIPDLGLEDIQEFLNRQYGEGKVSFSAMMEELVKGNFREAKETVFRTFWESILEEIGGSIGLLGQAAVLGILGAVFAQAAAVFPSSRIAEIGFFITYLLTFTCLTASFFTSVETAGRVVENVLDFMKVLLPSFFLAVAFAGGSISSAALYSAGRCFFL